MKDPRALPPFSRRRLLRSAGAAGLAMLAGTVLAITASSPAEASQNNWCWCYQCEGLWFHGNSGSGVCPAGGGHSNAGSGNYILKFAGQGGSGQSGWRWCRKCEGLWFHGHAWFGACPAGGGHSESLSGDYRIELTTSNDGSGGQNNWRWCYRCEGLCFDGHPGHRGPCPLSAGGIHDFYGSGDYLLRF